MKRTGSRKAGWLAKTILGGVAVLLGGAPAAAQMTAGSFSSAGGGGGGAGGGGAGGAGGAGGRTGGSGGSTPISSAGRTTTGSGAAGSNTSGPTANNSFQSYYSTPLAPGLGTSRTIAAGNFASSSSTGGSSGKGFTTNFTSGSGQIETARVNSLNQPLFATASSSLGKNTLGGQGGLTGTSGGTSFSTVGIRRAPGYITAVAFDAPPSAPPSAIQAKLREVLDRATTLKSAGNIQVAVNGETVVLQGVVPNLRERRVAEAMVRMSPGVRHVRNEIQVAGSKAPTE